VIRGRLLLAEAEKQKISVDELIAIQVNGAFSSATDDAVAQFFNSNKDQIEGSFADNASLIRDYLRSLDRQTAFDNLIARLHRDYEVKSFVEPQRTAVAADGHPSRGPDGAPVAIVEFADFECPYCGSLHPTLQRIAAEYKDQLRIVYLQFPLAGIHSHAEKASEASLCANEQGMFWPMHDAMFADQAHLNLDDLKQKASRLGINPAQFNKCLDSGKYLSQITEDLTEGMKAGVSGTPAMFINGRFLQGSVPYDDIQKIVEDELRRHEN
jgi:protein-disulfide isomerase